MVNKIVWGCNPTFQYEAAWIRSLIDATELAESNLSSCDCLFLVESGLIRLNKSISSEALINHDNIRHHRLHDVLALPCSNKIIIHLSDEEGFDGDSFYSLLPPDIKIFRNFNHTRFDSNTSICNFPIGPRDVFLQIAPESVLPASSRKFPWSFMGTVWKSGSRFEATSYFLKFMPNGFYLSTSGFGQGIPLLDYRDVLLQSTFSLAPEGDRHLDTFRLWESLSCGCIPLIVDHLDQSCGLLGTSHPLPVFNTWLEASSFAQTLLAMPSQLDELQGLVFDWWTQLRYSLYQSFIFSDYL